MGSTSMLRKPKPVTPAERVAWAHDRLLAAIERLAADPRRSPLYVESVVSDYRSYREAADALAEAQARRTGGRAGRSGRRPTPMPGDDRDGSPSRASSTLRSEPPQAPSSVQFPVGTHRVTVLAVGDDTPELTAPIAT